ncbi:MAG: hypothetical protein ACE5EB_08725 [Thermodesulfobacteriota bacterium]
MSKVLKPRFFIFTGRVICLLVLSVVISVAGGCAAKKGAVRAGYFSELSRWTRSKAVFKGLEDRLYISATFKSRSFRKAYAEYYAESYRLDSDYREVLLKREMDQAEKFNEVFFTVYTPEEDWNDFSRKDSVWKVYLEDNLGNRLAPISIETVEGSSSIIREFFPYFDLWSTAYTARFPKYSVTSAEPIPGKDTGYIKLVVTGVLGAGELKWALNKK